MDFQAIVMSSAEELQQLGCVRGDAMNLKHFAEKKLKERQQDPGKNERKRLLEEVLSQGTKTRGKQPSKMNVSRRKPIRKVHLGWFHFNEATKTYVQVKTQKGGGTRVVELPLLATREVIVSTGISCFFPNGTSTFGSSDEMEFSISNFQQQEIDSDDGFTLESYIDQFKLNRVTLYLMSRKGPLPRPPSTTPGSLTSDSDTDLERSVFETKSTPHQNNQPMVSAEALTERRRLVAEQDEQYMASLEADREKEKAKKQKLEEEVEADREKEKAKKQKLEEEVEKANWQTEIMLARKARVPDEPLPEEEKVVVRVRHVTCGIVDRAFKPDTLMASVYDWVGSLNITPENFVLSNMKNDLMPSESIQSIAQNSGCIVLNMRESQCMPPLAGHVNFRGFGEEAIDLNSTVSDDNHVLPTTGVPIQLMEDDSSVDESLPENNDDHHGTFSLDDPPVAAFQPPVRSSFVGQDVRDRGWHFRRWVNELVQNRSENQGYDGMQGQDMEAEVRRVTVRRDDILNAVLKLYMEDDDIVKCRLVIHFEGEVGIDFGGLTKDFFTSFWEEVFEKYFDGDVVKVPLVSPQKMGDSDRLVIQALGRILEHGWKLTGELPVRFCEASFVGMLHGEDAVPGDVLERSFLWYITDFERSILCSALEGGEVHEYKKDALFSLYRKFSMQCLPAASEDKLHEHIVAMARCEFLHKPMVILSWMRSGITELDSLQKSLSVQKICELYKVLSPTVTNVLKTMRAYCEDLRPDEERSYNFLTVYIGSMDGDQLLKFLHFVTGSTVTPVGTGITVCFNSTQGLSRVPTAATCSNTLTISTTYESYATFKKEFTNFLSSKEILQMNVL